MTTNIGTTWEEVYAANSITPEEFYAHAAYCKQQRDYASHLRNISEAVRAADPSGKSYFYTSPKLEAFMTQLKFADSCSTKHDLLRSKLREDL